MAAAALLDFPVSRVSDARLQAALEQVVEGILHTNDPSALRAFGQSLKMLGDAARASAFQADKRAW